MARRLKNWLASYMDYVDELANPPQYKLWAGIHAISAVLKKKVYIQYGPYKVYPNQYIILVGPPGIGKGTAINPATGLVKKANSANYLSDRITAERILQRLEQGFTHQMVNAQGQIQNVVDDKTATIISSELPILLSASEWMIPLLCELWEKGEFSHETKTKGSIAASSLCVGLLGACVPDYIRNLSTDSTSFITSGFSSRCVFVFASDRGKLVSWPEMDAKKQKLEDDLIEDLKYISHKFAGIDGHPFKLTTDARELWDKFYAKNTTINEFESDVVTNFKARMISHVLKLSLVLSVAEKDDTLITQTILFNAIAKIEEVKNNLDIAFRSVGESPLAAAQDRIIRYIEMRGYAPRSQILRDNARHITIEDLDRVLLVLLTAGFVIEEKRGATYYYRSTDKRIKTMAKGAGNGSNP